MSQEPRKRRPSPFALAALSSSVTAEIVVEDLLTLRKDWSREQAQRFLGLHAVEIGTSMVQAGLAAAVSIAARSNDHDN